MSGEKREIERGLDERRRFRVTTDRFGADNVTVLTTRNGYQWSGLTLEPEMVQGLIDILQEWQEEGVH